MRELKNSCTGDQTIVADARGVCSVGKSSIKGPIYLVPYERVGKYTIFVNMLGLDRFETHKRGGAYRRLAGSHTPALSRVKIVALIGVVALPPLCVPPTRPDRFEEARAQSPEIPTVE